MLEHPVMGNKEEFILKMKKFCKYCGNEFETHSSKPSLELYCSSRCKQLQERTNTNRHISICSNCGKEIHRYDKPKGKHVFCDKKCQGEYNHKMTYENRTCEYCGKTFETSKKSTQRFCSIQCQSKWQTTLVGDKAVRYKHSIPANNRVKECVICGKNSYVDHTK